MPVTVSKPVLYLLVLGTIVGIGHVISDLRVVLASEEELGRMQDKDRARQIYRLSKRTNADN